MAGIGFKLRAYTQEGTLAGLLRGYLGAAIISAGPWIITVATLSVATVMAQRQGHRLEHFQAILVYLYATSLILLGPVQNVIMRYISDRLYDGDDTNHLPTFVAATVVFMPLTAVVAALFAASLHLDLATAASTVALFAVICQIWLVTGFLGAIRAHQVMVLSFFVGAIAGLVAMYFLGPYGTAGYLAGYGIGQGTILCILTATLLHEFPIAKRMEFTYLTYFKRYWMLPASGVAFYLGIWLDKFIYWMSPNGVQIRDTWLRCYPPYDMGTFIAQLTIIPAMAIFFLRAETGFYEAYRNFYGKIQEKASLSTLATAKQRMWDAMKEGMMDIVAVQALITLAAILFTRQIFGVLAVGDDILYYIRIAATAAFFQTLFLFINISMFYFEFYVESLLCSIYLLTANAALTLVTLPFGAAWYGAGFIAATVLGCVVSAVMLARRMTDLEYITFIRQPVPTLVTGWRGRLVGKNRLGTYILRGGRRVTSATERAR